MEVGKHRYPWKGLWLKHQFTIMSWVGLGIGLAFTYHLVSDGDFSFLMTLGSVFVLFAFALLVAKAVFQRSISNISLKTLECYAMVFAARLTSILRYEGYLPYDRSGDWFYQATEVLCLIMVLGLIAAVVLPPLKDTYSRGRDQFFDIVPGLRLDPDLRAFQLAIPALILALILHPSLNNNFFTDTMWAFALYLEAVAMVPQVSMFNKMQKAFLDMEPFEGNFMFSIAIARFLHFIFWVSSYHELNEKGSGMPGDSTALAALTRRYPGHLVVVSQIVNIIVLGQFIVHHMGSARRYHLRI